LRYKDTAVLLFVANIHRDKPLLVEASQVGFPTIFIEHFNTPYRPVYSLPGPIT